MSGPTGSAAGRLDPVSDAREPSAGGRGGANPASGRRSERLDRVIRETLDGRDLGYERVREGAYLVKLEGQHKLATMTWLIVGEHSMHVEAFFCRQPDENHEEFYRFLLERGGRMYGVHFALDPVGDVYLVGRVSLDAVTPDEIDRLLGCVLTYADENFDKALELGFASSIRREWAWRKKRGESLANLRAFARFADPDR
ncbi:MAG: YbjN domain-containing protein [Streptosporangiales bacterium]|nr:YbjN domain-containing protein [Streptosporangiales bacterium]